jgi:hypothetical protein
MMGKYGVSTNLYNSYSYLHLCTYLYILSKLLDRLHVERTRTLCSAGGPVGAETAVGGCNDRAAMRVVNIDVLRANLRELPVARGGINCTADELRRREHHLSVVLGVKCVARRTAQDVLSESLPSPGAVLRRNQNTTVTSTNQRDVAPAPAVCVPAELKPCTEPMSLAVEHGCVNSALDATLPAIREGNKLGLTGIDPNVLVRNSIAVVVEGVKAPPVTVGVGDEDALATSVGVTPGQGWRSTACPGVALGLCSLSLDRLAYQATSLVAFELILRYGFDGIDIKRSAISGSCRGFSWQRDGSANKGKKRDDTHDDRKMV